MASFFEQNGAPRLAIEARLAGRQFIQEDRQANAQVRSAEAQATTAEAKAEFARAAESLDIDEKKLRNIQSLLDTEQAKRQEVFELSGIPQDQRTKLQASKLRQAELAERKATVELAKAYREETVNVPKSGQGKKIADIESDIANGHLTEEDGSALIARIKNPPDKNFITDKRAVTLASTALVEMINIVESQVGLDRIDPLVLEELAQQATIAGLNMKEAFGLGALNGPDMDLLNAVIKDPSSVGAILDDAITSGESSSQSLRRALKMVKQLGKQVEIDYNRKIGKLREPAFFESPFIADREDRELRSQFESDLVSEQVERIATGTALGAGKGVLGTIKSTAGMLFRGMFAR